MTARDLFDLARDLRAAGIPYETDDGSEHPLPMPVRHQTALYVALGHLCERIDAVHASASIPYSQLRTLGGLRRRTSAALDWIKALGKRSRWAQWFGGGS